jgi:hypothetical protein
MAFSIMTLSISKKCHYAECTVLFFAMMNVIYAECRYAECRYAECHGATNKGSTNRELYYQGLYQQKHKPVGHLRPPFQARMYTRINKSG